MFDFLSSNLTLLVGFNKGKILMHAGSNKARTDQETATACMCAPLAVHTLTSFASKCKLKCL